MIFRTLILTIGLICSAVHTTKATDIDSLVLKLERLEADSERVTVLNTLANRYIGNDPIKALDYANEALVLAVDLGFQSQRSVALSNLGIIAHNQGNYKRALNYYAEALTIRKTIDHKLFISYSYANIGNVYLFEGEYDKALDFHLRSLRIVQQLEDSSAQHVPLTNIGAIYYYQGDFRQAINYFIKSLEINIQYGSDKAISDTYNNIGAMYIEMGSADSALMYFNKAVDIKIESGDLQGISTSYNNIGSFFFQQNDYPAAIEYYNKSMAIDIELGNQQGIAVGLLNLGEAYEKQGKMQDAIDYYLRCKETAISIGSLYDMQTAADKLSIAYASSDKFQKALTYIKESTKMKDSLFNETKSKELGRLEAKYEMDRDLTEKQRQFEEDKIFKEEIQSRRDNLQYSGILIFIVLLFTGIFFVGQFSIPIRLAEGLIFFTFLLFFEFTLVLLDPYIEIYSSGAPAIKLAFNALLAALIFPLHSWFENNLKRRLLKEQAN